MLEKQNNKVAHKADYRGMLTEMFCDHGHTKTQTMPSSGITKHLLRFMNQAYKAETVIWV